MAGSSLPPGFRFRPTDEELVGYYLKRKVEGLEIELELIPVIDFYKFDPWELPEKSFLPKRDMEWFFFCPRDRKYPNGSRTNRATKAGYWKATGKDRKVTCHSSSTLGYRKTLVFHRGRAPLGDRTDWIMYEYRLFDDVSLPPQGFQGPLALCRVMKKNGNLNDNQSGASSSSHASLALNGITHEPLVTLGSNNASRTDSSYQNNPTMDYEPCSIEHTPSTQWLTPDLHFDSSMKLQEGEMHLAEYTFQSSLNPWSTFNQSESSFNSLYSNFTEEFEGILNQEGFHGK